MPAQLKGKSISKYFDDAMEHLGGIKGIAKVIGVSETHARRLRRGTYRLRFEYAMMIETATNGKIKAQDLVPSEILSVEKTMEFLKGD